MEIFAHTTPHRTCNALWREWRKQQHVKIPPNRVVCVQELFGWSARPLPHTAIVLLCTCLFVCLLCFFHPNTLSTDFSNEFMKIAAAEAESFFYFETLFHPHSLARSLCRSLCYICHACEIRRIEISHQVVCACARPIKTTREEYKSLYQVPLFWLPISFLLCFSIIRQTILSNNKNCYDIAFRFNRNELVQVVIGVCCCCW